MREMLKITPSPAIPLPVALAAAKAAIDARPFTIARSPSVTDGRNAEVSGATIRDLMWTGSEFRAGLSYERGWLTIRFSVECDESRDYIGLDALEYRMLAIEGHDGTMRVESWTGTGAGYPHYYASFGPWPALEPLPDALLDALGLAEDLR